MSGSLPCDWKVVYPDDVVTGKRSIVSGPFGSNIGQRFFVETGIPVIRGNNLTLGKKRFVDNGFVFLTEEKAKEFKNCQALAGDIVFTAAGTLGQVGIIPQNAKFPVYIISNKQLRLRPDPSIAHPEYLYYWFSSENVRDYIIGLNTGSSVPLITLGKLRSVPINLPPLPTQQKIAAILSAYDDLIENNTRRIKILEEMAQAIYREWFVNFRFPGHEGVRMVESELGLVPEGWEVVRLSTIAEINTDSIKRGQEPERIGYIDISSVATGSIDKIEWMKFLDAPGRARRIVNHGDMIWSTVRPNRKSYCLILNPEPNTIVSTGFAVIRGNKIPYSYLYQNLTTDDFVSYLTNNATGAAYPAVKTDDFEKAKIIRPDDTLLEKFHEIVEPILEIKFNLSQKNANLRRTRDLLLPKLISGEFDVSELEIFIPEVMET